MDDVDHFVRRHQAPIWRYLRLLGASPSDADDLLQETLVRYLTWHAEQQAAAASAPTSALLRRIARGLWIDSRRWLARRRAVQWADEIDASLANTTPPDDDADPWLDALATCREKLPPRSRRAVELAYRDGLGRDAIARELGLAANTVRNLLAGIRDTLRTCIEARVAHRDSDSREGDRS